MINKFLYILFLMIFLASCEKSVNWKLQHSVNEYLIVEGVITNEYLNHKIIIKKSFDDINGSGANVLGANVSVYDGFKRYPFSEDSLNPGVYYSDEKFIGVVNKTYSLNIVFSDEIYSAVSEMLPVIDYEPVSYIFDSIIGSYTLANYPSQFSSDEDAMYIIEIDRSNTIEYADSAYNVIHSVLYFYTLTSFDVSELFSPQTELVYFPQGTIITERKYSLTQAHAQFYRSLLLETTWRGGVFDLDQGNVVTNITNGALGFFGACSVIEKKIVIQ
ncbi:MAG: DUF4249 family protein [Bacteroidales bacterium]|nr:DUF4249 family protein [Bacteroidales bacterium]